MTTVNKSWIKLDLSKEDLVRQSYAHINDYSFGFPVDFDNKENNSNQMNIGVKASVNNQKYKNSWFRDSIKTHRQTLKPVKDNSIYVK